MHFAAEVVGWVTLAILGLFLLFCMIVGLKEVFS